jgi:hypothetical protein
MREPITTRSPPSSSASTRSSRVIVLAARGAQPLDERGRAGAGSSGAALVTCARPRRPPRARPRRRPRPARARAPRAPLSTSSSTVLRTRSRLPAPSAAREQLALLGPRDARALRAFRASVASRMDLRRQPGQVALHALDGAGLAGQLEERLRVAAEDHAGGGHGVSVRLHFRAMASSPTTSSAMRRWSLPSRPATDTRGWPPRARGRPPRGGCPAAPGCGPLDVAPGLGRQLGRLALGLLAHLLARRSASASPCSRIARELGWHVGQRPGDGRRAASGPPPAGPRPARWRP